MAISFNQLGSHGRLGNQIFQFSAIKSIAKFHNYQFIIPESGHQLRECFQLNNLTQNNYGINNVQYRICERLFNFDQELFERCPDNIDIQGYFQTEKYFNHISNELKSDLIFHENILQKASNFLDSITREPLISLHIRRTDYINHPRHGGCCTEDYYKIALDLLPKDIKVIVFSDDPNWIKTQYLYQSDRFIVSHNDAFVDLCIMSLCDFHIIANSSFSWWGSWLSYSEKTIAPKKWFTTDANIDDWSDIYPQNKNWIII